MKRSLSKAVAFLLVTLASIFWAPYQALATSDGRIEKVYVELDLLTKNERQFLQTKIALGQVSPLPGGYAVIYPDGREPLTGIAAQEAFLKGDVTIMSFSGLPNSFWGSMNVGKKIAQANGAPVLAIHSGYGDLGTMMVGPTSFFGERELNGKGVPYMDPVLTTPYLLLTNSKLQTQTPVTIVGYCLGAIKAANLAFWLQLSRPELLKSLQVMSLALSVRLPEALVHQRQVMGNLDHFGRINSTKLLDAMILRSASHTIRADVADSLPVPPISEVFGSDYQWLPEPVKVGELSDAELEKQTQDALVKTALTWTLIAEAKADSKGTLTDRLHMAHLQRRRAILGSRVIEFRLEGLKRQGLAETDPRVVSLQSALAADQKELETAEKTYAELLRQRNGFTDFAEYQSWKRGTCANVFASK